MVTIDKLADAPVFLLDEKPQEWLPGLEAALREWSVVDSDAAMGSDAATISARAFVMFAAKGASHELAQFASTGRSNGRPMQWSRMRIPKGSDFGLHAHPNVEIIVVVRGTVYERRLAAAPPTRGPFYQNLYPLDLSSCTDFETLAHVAPTMIVNEVGSVHKSYTLEADCDLFCLWSGAHLPVAPQFTPPDLRATEGDRSGARSK